MTAEVAAAPARRWDALSIHADDDVAVALDDLAAGARARVRRGDAIAEVALLDAITLGHKFALHAIARGSPIRKYGEQIGLASADIATGAHVHVHNLVSARARHTQ